MITWMIATGSVLLLMAAIGFYPGYKYTKNNTNRKDRAPYQKISMSGYDWFKVYIGHYLYWTVWVLLLVGAGGLIFVGARG